MADVVWYGMGIEEVEQKGQAFSTRREQGQEAWLPTFRTFEPPV